MFFCVSDHVTDDFNNSSFLWTPCGALLQLINQDEPQLPADVAITVCSKVTLGGISNKKKQKTVEVKLLPGIQLGEGAEYLST